MRSHAIGAALLALLLPSALAVAAGVPSVAPGWPVPTMSGGEVLPRSVGGVVVSNGFTTTAAYRRDGGIDWVAGRDPACGNCDSGPFRVRLQPDGSYGPVGVTGDDFWSVGADGTLGAGCKGVVAPGGVCFEANEVGGARLAARTSAGPRWTLTPAGLVPFRDFAEAGQPTALSADGRRVYVGFTAGQGPSQGPRVLAVDAATGVALWTQVLRDVPSGGCCATAEVLGELPGGGVLVRHWRVGEGRQWEEVISFDADGGERWRRPAATGSVFAADAGRGIVYLQDGREVVAVDAVTGATRWTFAPGSALLHSLTRSGDVLASRQDARGFALVALRPTGAVRWVYPTLTAVRSAREIGDGSVVLAAEAADVVAASLLVRIVPGRAARLPASVSVGLSRSRFAGPSSVLDGSHAWATHVLSRETGTILRVSTPGPLKLTVALRRRDGGALPPDRQRFRRLVAPAGTTYARLLVNGPPGDHSLVVRSGSRVLARFPVSIASG